MLLKPHWGASGVPCGGGQGRLQLELWVVIRQLVYSRRALQKRTPQPLILCAAAPLVLHPHTHEHTFM